MISGKLLTVWPCKDLVSSVKVPKKWLAILQFLSLIFSSCCVFTQVMVGKWCSRLWHMKYFMMMMICSFITSVGQRKKIWVPDRPFKHITYQIPVGRSNQLSYGELFSCELGRLLGLYVTSVLHTARVQRIMCKIYNGIKFKVFLVRWVNEKDEIVICYDRWLNLLL